MKNRCRNSLGQNQDDLLYCPSQNQVPQESCPETLKLTLTV